MIAISGKSDWPFGHTSSDRNPLSSHNCASPTWAAPVDADLNPLAKILWKNITEDWWGALDNAKRHCVIAEVRGDFGQNLQECVGRKIPGFTISQPSQDSFTLSQDQKEKLLVLISILSCGDSISANDHLRLFSKKLAEHRLRIEIADNKCDGGKKWQHLRQCRKKVRDENNNKDSCDVRRKCAASWVSLAFIKLDFLPILSWPLALLLIVRQSGLRRSARPSANVSLKWLTNWGKLPILPTSNSNVFSQLPTSTNFFRFSLGMWMWRRNVALSYP